MAKKETPPPRPSLTERFPDVHFSVEKTAETPFQVFDRDLDEELWVSEDDHVKISQRRQAEARGTLKTEEASREKEIRQGFRKRFSLVRFFKSRKDED